MPSSSGTPVTAPNKGWAWSLATVLDAYRQANRLIWRRGLWRYWVIPGLLAVMYLPGLVWMISGLSDWLTLKMKGGGDPGTFGWWAWRLFWWGLLGMVGWFSYRGVVLLFHAPFLDAISERVEKELKGRDVVPAMTWFPMAVRSLKVAVVTGVLSLFLAILNIGMSFVPVVGWVVSVGILIPLQMWLAGVQALDPYLGRNGDRARRSLWRACRRPMLVTLLGGIGTLILLIPVVGWFVGPTYLVVAGVVVGIRMVDAAGNGD